jgi:hypothetical protein
MRWDVVSQRQRHVDRRSAVPPLHRLPPTTVRHAGQCYRLAHHGRPSDIEPPRRARPTTTASPLPIAAARARCPRRTAATWRRAAWRRDWPARCWRPPPPVNLAPPSAPPTGAHLDVAQRFCSQEQTVAGKISTYTSIGSFLDPRVMGTTLALSPDRRCPTASGIVHSRASSGRAIGTGFEVTSGRPTTPVRILTVYVARLELDRPTAATLSDGSAPAYVRPAAQRRRPIQRDLPTHLSGGRRRPYLISSGSRPRAPATSPCRRPRWPAAGRRRRCRPTCAASDGTSTTSVAVTWTADSEAQPATPSIARRAPPALQGQSIRVAHLSPCVCRYQFVFADARHSSTTTASPAATAAAVPKWPCPRPDTARWHRR